VGTFKEGRAVIRHSGHFTLDRNPEPGDETRVCLPHPNCSASCKRASAC
jgi:pyruvate kinase